MNKVKKTQLREFIKECVNEVVTDSESLYFGDAPTVDIFKVYMEDFIKNYLKIPEKGSGTDKNYEFRVNNDKLTIFIIYDYIGERGQTLKNIVKVADTLGWILTKLDRDSIDGVWLTFSYKN